MADEIVRVGMFLDKACITKIPKRVRDRAERQAGQLSELLLRQPLLVYQKECPHDELPRWRGVSDRIWDRWDSLFGLAHRVPPVSNVREQP